MARKKDGKDSNSDQSNIISQQALQNNGKTSGAIVLHDTFREQLEQLGLQIREMPGDGNCLFRALGDQMNGHCRNHLKHRHEVTQFMMHNRKDFEPFVEDDVTFERYIRQLRQPGTYAGNDVIVAFARLHQLDIIIHQMNSPPWVIQGSEEVSDRQLHISYSNGDHYSSIRRLGDNKQLPANIKIKTMFLCEEAPVAKKKGGVSSPAHGTAHPASPSHQERLHKEENDSMIECIIAATDCTDRNLIRDTLLSCENDVEKCIEAVMTLLYDQLEEAELEETSLPVQNGARPKTNSSKQIPQISAKAERKLNKRERAIARHKEALLNNQLPNNQLPNNQLQDDETIVNSLSTLQI